MTREQFEHAVRAAGAVLDENEILVSGSQAIHASLAGPLPPEARRSIEVDIAVEGDRSGERADLLDGAIGELSVFHATFGYYARGVVESTAVLPSGWRERLVAFTTSATGGVTALCLEPHDLWVSKAIAHRPKDIELCAALLRENVVDPTLLRTRLSSVADLSDKRRGAAESLVSPT